MTKVKVLKERHDNSTDVHLQVKSLSNYDIHEWDSAKVVAALREECKLTKGDAEKIANTVYEELVAMGKTEIDIQTLKMIVNYHLLKNGFNGAKLSGQVSVGMSLYDLDNLIREKSSENSNISRNNPEAIALIVAENTFKKYALKKVFAGDVERAHLEGLIHLHDMGCITKVYCSAHSVRAIAMHGLGQFLKFDVRSSPAKHAQVLVGHINTFLCSAATYYAGALGLDFVNIYFAPYVEKMSAQEMKQVAQYLIFSLSQSAFSRGGQVLFTDFNVHISIPDWLKKVQAVGPGGKMLTKIVKGDVEITRENFNKFFDDMDTWEDIELAAKEGRNGLVVVKKTYADYEEVSKKFLKSMMEVWRAGDSNGAPFAFPKMDFHLSEKDFTENKDIVMQACEIAGENGSPYFIFDHDSITVAACCRLRTKIEDPKILEEPERLRFCGFMNVTINLPQCAYRSNGDWKAFEKEVMTAMELAKKAHLQKKKFIESISQNPGDPMYDLCGAPYFDGKPYVHLPSCTYIIGMIGLNEALKFMVGQEMHDSDGAFEKGKDVVAYMLAVLGKFKKETGLKFTLEESPAESTARRLARCDVGKYEIAKKFVNGSLEDDNVYYTNSIHFRPDADIPFVERVFKQSEFHNMIESGAIVHMFCGENMPEPSSLFTLLEKVFHETNCAQLVVSPEFTVCQKCGRFPGLKETCPKCGNKDVDRITRVVGYYSKVDNWNVSKKREGQDRHSGQYTI
jgi:ribonucleoside-triphosphate reductase